jgi:glycine cleavage system H protein
MFPEQLKYAKSHEWVKVEGNSARIGLSDFAIKQLSDLVFIDLPEVGSEVKAEEPFGEIESVKAVSDLYSPLSGKVTEVNTNLADQPESLSKDAYENGWLIKLEMSDPSELDQLLDAGSYQKITEEGEH